MKLSDVQDNIQNGDVFLFEGRSWFARLIKARTRSIYSHAGCALWIGINGTKTLCVLEALEPHGVRLYPMDRYVAECAAKGVRVHWFELDPCGSENVNRDHVAAYVFKQLGKRYVSPWQFFVSWGWLTRWLRRLLGKGVENLDPERFFCSELVAAALRAGGYRPDPDEDVQPAATDPGSVSMFPCLQRRGVVTP